METRSGVGGDELRRLWRRAPEVVETSSRGYRDELWRSAHSDAPPRHQYCYLHDELFLWNAALLVVSVTGQLLYKQTEHTFSAICFYCERLKI